MNIVHSVRTLFLQLCAIVGGLWSAMTAPGQSMQIEVSPHGPGLSTALRELRGRIQPGNITQGGMPKLILQTGIYSLSAPLIISADNSGPSFPSLSIQAAPGAHPVLSGGTEIGGWKKLTGSVLGLPPDAWRNVWIADAPKIGGEVLEFRQLWIDGRKAIRAREPNGENMFRLAGWDKAGQTATIPAMAVASVGASGSMEMIIDQIWEIADLRVQSFSIQGTNALVRFCSPESGIEFQHPWPPVIVNSNYAAPFFLANAIQFLDSPGEWFEDVRAGKIYYWPRAGENMAEANAFIPTIETLVQIQGADDHPVSHIEFTGITFAYTTWLRPSKQGHVPLQDGMYLLEAKKLRPRGTAYHPGLDNLAWIGRPPAAVTVNFADYVSFENCTFEHLASAGLDLENSTHDDTVEGCSFQDIGGNGIQVGKYSDPKVETHLPYNPVEKDAVCTRINISNNVFHDCANEDWGCTGISVGYARQIKIAHNEVFDLPYTGISVGWGWTKHTNALGDNFIFANHVHNIGQRLGDLGGIYLLSAQPGTAVEANAISDIQPSPYVPDPLHWYYIYLDEGSSFITVRDNWCPADKFLKNANGPGDVWINNGPQVSENIKNNAGLEPAFKGLLSDQQP